MRNIRLLTLACILLFATHHVLADTETNPVPSGSDVVVSGTSYSIAATYIAGEGGAKLDPMTSKGVKFRLNRSASGISNGIEFTVNSGYTITSIDFCGIANDNSKTATLSAVYVDGADDAHKLANIPSVTLPHKKASAAASFTLSGFNATQKIILAFSGSSMASQANIEYTVTYSGGATPPLSSDATLSSIVYGTDLTPVANFSSSQEHYDVELPAGYVGSAPSVQATTTHSAASTNITQATTLPGTATIVVTAEDGTTTKTYTVTFSVASALPKVLTATWPNIQGTAVIDNVNMTITGQVKPGTGLTSITPTFTGTNIISWETETGQTASIDFTQPVVIIFSAATGHVESYTVTITEAPQLSSDATLRSMTYGGTPVPNFSPTTTHYDIEMPYGIKSPPAIDGELNDPKATKVVTQAPSVPGTGNIRVTAEDGVTVMTYSITYTTTAPTPPTTLTTHVPEIYEAKEIAGGYNTPLTRVNDREYEVYYINREGDNLSVTTTNVDRATSLTNSDNKMSAEAKDGWFTINTTSNHGGDTNAGAKDEFASSIRSVSMKDEDEICFHVQGYDQFSFYGKDNSTSNDKFFHVYIDDVLQTTPAPKSEYTIRRYDMTTADHVIRIAIKSGVTSNSKFCSFSFRVAKEPRTKWLKGNDTTQVVLQTTAIKPVTYVTKYNNIPGAQTRLVWLNGREATGIGLQKISGTLSDTLVLSGNANCPTGEYQYAVIAYYNGKETSRAIGSFKVKSDIQSTSDLKVDVYQNEEMDGVTFKYYALSANDVRLTWTGSTPNGITGNGMNGKYVIGGTPTTTGVYPFEITVLDADTVLKGQITVLELDYGDNAVLYLYKNHLAYEKDGVYQYLISEKGGKHNIIARKAKENGLRPIDQYANYKWAIVSEDADADNVEVLDVIRGGANLPVLNLKGFTYSPDRLNWGEPDNGAIDSAATKKQGCTIVVEQATHPIYKLTTTAGNGKPMNILSNYESNGVMPITVNNSDGTLCLATGYTRNIENYYALGALQTAIHEIPAYMRGGKKYICLPLARGSQLNSNGEKLLSGIVEYLLSPEPTSIVPPELEILSFKVAGEAAVIDQDANTITLRLTEEQFTALDSLRATTPEIVVADPTTHVIPNGIMDLQYMYILPKTFEVTDYINRRAYDFIIDLYDPTQGIDEVYEAGQWVNVFDIYGRKVTTTNENIYTMELPHGMYIIVTESGQTLKIMR